MISIRELLCATDIERPASAALRYAFFLAERCHASLHVVHAWAHSEGVRVAHEQTRTQLSDHALSQQGLHARLDAVVRAISPTPGHATTHIIDGKLPAAIVDYSERHKSDLILLGSMLGAEPFSPSLGTLAQQIGHGAICPVLTVPHDKTLPVLQLRRILLPLELEGSMSKATEWTVLLARRFDAVIELLRAPITLNADAERLDRCQAGVVEALRLGGVRFEHGASSAGKDLTSSILKRAERGFCDLVVMATHARDARQSGALATVRRTSVVPVLSVRTVASEHHSQEPNSPHR